MRRLIAAPRLSLNDTLPEIFPYGWYSGKFEGITFKPTKRDKKEHRSIVLVLAAALDQALEAAIVVRLPGILPGNESYIFSDEAAPLRDLDAKIRIGFALGVYGDKARADLSLLKSIRNTFAHSRFDLHFDLPELAEACAHFTLPTRSQRTFGSMEGDHCQTFVDVGLQYVIHLLPSADRSQQDKARKWHYEVLDLPQPSLPQKSQ